MVFSPMELKCQCSKQMDALAYTIQRQKQKNVKTIDMILWFLIAQYICLPMCAT